MAPSEKSVFKCIKYDHIARGLRNSFLHVRRNVHQINGHLRESFKKEVLKVEGFDSFDVLVNRKGGILSKMGHVPKKAT